MTKYILKKYFKPIIILTLVVVLLQIAVPVFALEVQYPSIPGAPENGPQVTAPDTVYNLAAYIDYVFLFIVSTTGIVAVITIVVSGLQILLSAGSAGAISTAKERMFGSIFGIVVLLFAFILLQTINPDLIKSRTAAEVMPSKGLFYYTDQWTVNPEHPNGIWWEDAPEEEMDVMRNVARYYRKLFYKCATPNAEKKLLVWVYNDTFLEFDRDSNGDPNMKTIVLSCGPTPDSTNTINLFDPEYPILSFFQQEEEPGVYLYLDDNCRGLSSSSYTANLNSSFSDIGSLDGQNNDDDMIRSIRIVSGDIQGRPQRYGFILKENTSECSEPVVKIDPGTLCVGYGVNVDQPMPSTLEQGSFFNPTSIHVFLQNPDPIPRNPGLAIRLRSEHLEYNLTDQMIGTRWSWSGDLNQTMVNGLLFTGAAAQADECNNENTDCLRSITINDPGRRSYEITLYAKSIAGGANTDAACQIFRSNIGPDAESLEDLLQVNRKIYRTEIIPSDTH